MDSLKNMLKSINIKTTNIWTVSGYSGTNYQTKGLCFSIKTESFKSFSDNINFRIKKKKDLLKKIMGSTMWDKSRF